MRVAMRIRGGVLPSVGFSEGYNVAEAVRQQLNLN